MPARPARCRSVCCVVWAFVGVTIVGCAGGCAARPDRFRALRESAQAPWSTAGQLTDRSPNAIEITAAPPDVRHGELTGRAGYASFGGQFHLRADSPSLTETLAHAIEAERSAGIDPRWIRTDVVPFDAGPSGPQGPVGWCDSVPCFEPSYGGRSFGPIGFVPVGSLPPGIRSPSDPEPAGRSFTAYRGLAPDSDAFSHRPGLSTGSGIYARSGAR